jgi:hypothetical protein
MEDQLQAFRSFAWFWIAGTAVMLTLVTLTNLLPLHERESILWNLPYENYKKSPAGLTLDWWTECLGLGIGVPNIPGTALTKALQSPTYSNCEELHKGNAFTYGRFWHGYQIVSAPLIYLADVKIIGWVSSITFYAGLFTFLWWSGQHRDWKLFSSAAGAFTLMPFYSQIYLITHSLTWALAFFSSVVLFGHNPIGEKVRHRHSIRFFVLGMATSFVSLLTTPLVGLTLPLTVIWVRNAFRNHNCEEVTLNSFAAYSAAWALGYVSAFLSKWILVELLTPESIFREAINQVIFRLTGQIYGGGYAGPAEIFVHLLGDGHLAVAAIAILFVAIARSGCIYATARTGILATQLALTLAFVSGLPFVWSLVVRQHTWEHATFVGPIFFPSAFLLLFVSLRPDLIWQPKSETKLI